MGLPNEGCLTRPNLTSLDLHGVPRRIAKIDRPPIALPCDLALNRDAIGSQKRFPRMQFIVRATERHMPRADGPVRRHLWMRLLRERRIEYQENALLINTKRHTPR